MITGIHHVSMKCASAEELERAAAFYTGVLGLTVKRRWSAGILLDTGCGYIEIFSTGEGSRETGAVRHFALAVDDVDAYMAKARAAGCELLTGPKDIEMDSAPPFRARMGFCRGPLGEQIEFFMEYGQG